MNLQYIAGFLDGEGCIQIVKTTKAPNVSISQSSREVLEAIKEFVGAGGVYEIKKRRLENKQMYHWVVTGLNAIEFLETVVEMLWVKRREAELLISKKDLFQRHRKKLSIETIEGREKLRQDLKKLKH